MFTKLVYNKIMKILLFILSLSVGILACTGDCLTCHPNLVPTIQEDKRHKPMLTCITCHSAIPNSMADCGSDCFACHPMSKINGLGVKEHEVIQGCRDCHVAMKQELFGINKKNESTLKDALFNLD